MPPRNTRVAHVLGSLEYAGLQRTVLALIRELPAYSHTVVFNSRGPLYDEFAATCDMIQCPYTRGSLVQGARYAPRLARVLRECAPDVVIGHLFGNHALVSLAAWMAGVPATYGVSANDPVHYARSRWQPMMLAQIARPFCRGEIAVSRAVGAVLRRELLLPARRVHVVANGLAVEEVAARADRGRSARTGSDEHQLLMVAWIARSKDHETAIRSVAVMRQMGLNVVLNLAGGAYRQARQAHVEKLVETLGISAWVRFLGVRNDIPELMGASDVVIHASHSEGLPITILEALASRTPVVASDIPACREALDGGRCGVLVPPKDPVALANGVKSLLENSGQRRRVVETAFDHVRERYHHRRMAAGYAALIEQAGSR